MKNWKLARRDLLKHLGVGAACLPLLQATKGWAQAKAPQRFIILQMSEGLIQASFRPTNGPLGALRPILAPLEAFKQNMVVISGMNNPGVGGGHGSYGCVYYGLGGTGGGQYKEPTGKTVDQVIAAGLPKPASGRLSLNLHIQMEREPRSTTMPGGTKCFWTGAGQPINPTGDPYAVYKDIFAGGDVNPNADPAAIRRLMAQKKSILDYIGGSLDDFKARLGKDDQISIEAHHESVRQLETQLQQAPSDNSKCGGSPAPGIDLTALETYPLIMKAHLNLITAALKCGITNVGTLQTGDSSGNNIAFGAFVKGLPLMGNGYKSKYTNWHELGHNPGAGGKNKQIADTWFMQQWADFLTLLKGVPDAGGTLLDNTVVLIGNHVGDGGAHSSNDVPFVLFAKPGGYFNTGTAISGGPVKAIFAGIAEHFGIMNHPYGAPTPGLKKG
jgi:hypothetical protein